MKKTISIIAAVLAFLAFANFTYAEASGKSNILDLSDYNVEELLQIRDEVDDALYKKDGLVIAEEGTYVVGKDIGEGTYIIKPYPAGSLGIGVLNYVIYIDADAKKEYEIALNTYNTAYKNAQAEKDAGKTPVWPEKVNESEYIIASGDIDSEEGETGRSSLKEGEILVFTHSWEAVDITIQKTTGLFMD